MKVTWEKESLFKTLNCSIVRSGFFCADLISRDAVITGVYVYVNNVPEIADWA